MPDQYVTSPGSFSALALARQALNENRPRTAAQLYRLVECFWPELQSVQVTRDIVLAKHQVVLPPLTVLIWCDSSAELSRKLLQLSAQPYPLQQVILCAVSADMLAELSLKLPEIDTDLNVTVAPEVALSRSVMWQQYIDKGVADEQILLAIPIQASLEPIDLYQFIAQELYSPARYLGQPLDGANTWRVPAELPRLDLVLTLNTELNGGALADALAWLTRYFALKVYLTAATPELVFDNSELMLLLEEGVIERLQITDQQPFFADDSIEFVKKLPAQQLFLCNAVQCSRHVFALYRFYYCAERPAIDQYGIVACLSPGNAGQLLSGDVIPPDFQYLLFGAAHATARKNGFITATAVSRLGGFPAFTAMPLSYGSVAFTDIDQWWLLANSHAESNASLRTIPQQIALTDKSCLLFDLQPAVVYEAPLGQPLPAACHLLRRWLITARIMPVPQPLGALPPARFVMTSYNKAAFLTDSLYSLVLQTYSDCHVLVLDDASSDNSLTLMAQLQNWLPAGFVEIESGPGKQGTYRLRNKAIACYADSDTVYLVNDADDLSTARRAELQLSRLAESNFMYTFADIVRVNAQGQVLTLDGVVERYGTASFCAVAAVHQQYGYYENLRKGADTEFIERLARFAPKGTGGWWRYPLLFQSFDGNNLTSDIYTVTNEGELAQDISARSPYLALFRQRHQKLLLEWLPRCFTADNRRFPTTYFTELPDFFMPDTVAEFADDTVLLRQFDVSYFQQAGFETLPAGLQLAISAEHLLLASTLAAEQHAYLLVTQRFSPLLWQAGTDQLTAMLLEVESDVGISACLIYQDELGKQLSHQFFWANQLMPVKMPRNCHQVQLGFRLQGTGIAKVKSLELRSDAVV